MDTHVVEVRSDLQVSPERLDNEAKAMESDALRVVKKGFDDSGFVELELWVKAESESQAIEVATAALERWVSDGADWVVKETGTVGFGN